VARRVLDAYDAAAFAMKTSTTFRDRGTPPEGFAAHWKAELAGILALLAMTGWFIATSWRKWPDPLVDVGTQWFVFWRLSQGARLYHDVIWNYGPVSAWFNAGLFRRFGPGMMVLATANLAVYGLILALAYAVFRKAWGRLGAFAALAVFIAVFSFSRLNSVGDYNFITPYASESTHGFLLLLVTALVVAWWCHGPSGWLAFFLGLCGGLAVVLKPEFMLATGLLGFTACVIRLLQRQRPSVVEFLLIATGLALPTLAFTLKFARGESLASAFIDASQAWWQVLVDRHRMAASVQAAYLGLDQPRAHALLELKAALGGFTVIAAIWAAGWIANRPWVTMIRVALVVATGFLAYHFLPGFAAADGWTNGWLFVGACFPGMMAAIFCLIIARAAGQLRRTGRVEESTTMALALALLAGAMLVRMLLHARIDHLGFYQSALAGMVTAAFMVAEVPRWTGAGAWGRRVSTWGSLAALGAGCVMIAKMSYVAHTRQTVPVGSGRDLFYCDAPEIDATGTLVEWTVEYFRTVPARATVCVLPEGAMINYLSRRMNPLSACESEEELVAGFRRTPPDYAVFISRDLANPDAKRYSAPGEPGYLLVQWLRANYTPVTGQGGNPLDPHETGVVILRRGPPALPPRASPVQGNPASTR
jgi:hypothetical protein